MRTRATVLSVFAALSAGTVAVGAPDERVASQFAERVEVRLVQVDAWAVASGEPVLDLTQGELKLYEDGKPVDILYFAAPLADAAPPPTAPEGAAAPPAAAAAERFAEPVIVAIFLDEAHLGGGSRSRTIAALRDWVAGGGLPQGASTMLVAHERELKVVLGRTRDQARLLDALDNLRGPSPVAVETRTAERRAIDQIRDHQRTALETMREMPQTERASELAPDGGGDALRYFEPPCSGRILQYADDLADQVAVQAEESLDSLSAFAGSLAALRGRKTVLFVSEGMPSRPGGVAYDYVRTLCDGTGLREGIPYSIDVSAQAGGGALSGQLSASGLALAGASRQLTQRVDRVVANANSSGVTVWSFGARGLTSSGDDASQEVRTATAAALARQKGESEDVMNALAVDTGGRAILESNRLDLALGQLVDDLFDAYSIAFASPRAGDGKLHQIKLETTRPGVRLRYRRSWRDASTEEELAGLVGGALSFGIDRPGLGAVATIGRQTGESGTQRLILRLTLPRAALTPVPGGKGLLRLAIALQPAGGEATPIRTRTITVETTDAGGEPIVQDIALPEIGRGALVAVGVRDEISGEIGVFRLEVGGS